MYISLKFLIAGLAVISVMAGSAVAQPVISIEGDCPGRVIFRWEGATPQTPAAIVYAMNTGQIVVPSGRCGGTVLGLGATRIQGIRSFNTGPNGRGAMSGQAAVEFCGGYLQMLVLDGLPCTTSNVVQVPQ